MARLRDRHILVKGGKMGLPFSKGLMATSMLAIGVDPGEAHRVAELVQERLRAEEVTEVTVEELREVVTVVLREEVGEPAATRYRLWQQAQERELPLLVLIGGATGSGKSTVATQVAQRLGVTRIISTDAIREVMRATVSAELLPSLHVSSFESATAVRTPYPDVDPLLAGFLRQTQAVTVGIQHLLDRAVEERVDTVVEGVHVVPGALQLPQDAIVVQLLLWVDEEERHRSHLSGRSLEEPERPMQRYLDRFEEIRRIQGMLIRRAERADIPCVRSYALDQTISQITELIVDEVTRRQLEGRRGQAG